MFFPTEEGGRENVLDVWVLNYAGCFAEVAGSVDRVNGWEAVLRDDWAASTTFCSFLRSWAEQ